MGIFLEGFFRLLVLLHLVIVDDAAPIKPEGEVGLIRRIHDIEVLLGKVEADGFDGLL